MTTHDPYHGGNPPDEKWRDNFAAWRAKGEAADPPPKEKPPHWPQVVTIHLTEEEQEIVYVWEGSWSSDRPRCQMLTGRHRTYCVSGSNTSSCLNTLTFDTYDLRREIIPSLVRFRERQDEGGPARKTLDGLIARLKKLAEWDLHGAPMAGEDK